jgi:hypothetical protein
MPQEVELTARSTRPEALARGAVAQAVVKRIMRWLHAAGVFSVILRRSPHPLSYCRIEPPILRPNVA